MALGLSLSPARSAPLDEPIRAELFGLERLEQHAQTLATAQVVSRSQGHPRPLLGRVVENGQVLKQAYLSIAEAVAKEHTISPAAEWLVDNFFIVDEQLQKIHDDLPSGFYRVLPKLAEGHLAGYPRVYGIAWAFVAHSDSRFDFEALRRFVRAYQKVQPLDVGELWALAISLRVVLVENLRRLAESVVRRAADRAAADQLADELVSLGGDPLGHARALRSHEQRPFSDAFAVELVHRLRDEDPAASPALLWLNQHLAARGTSSDELVRLEHQRQAATSLTVRNVITSMRQMSELDWPQFVESVSLVDELLAAGSRFAAMDFTSRDGYRHAIEELARGAKKSELEVARTALRLAQRSPASSPDAAQARQADPGHFLIGAGRLELERTLGVRLTLAQWALRTFITWAKPGYLGTILLLTAGVLAVPLFASSETGASLAGLIVFALLAAIPASELAISLLNHSITAVFVPRLLPRLELREGLPPELRTLVVVPTMLFGRASIEAQVLELEVIYLSNPEPEVRLALVTDWVDAPTEHLPEDDAQLALAQAGIATLNQRHGPARDGTPRFFLLHRARRWNEAEQKWMGWERKRGKLHELNRLLRGATDTSFLPAAAGAPPAAPTGVRYVITLDSDTQLPMGAVKRLVGALAHPLNRPAFDPISRRVVSGHAVLQPRVTPLLPERRASIFQRLSSGPSGVDPYAGAVSDVYQDLFGEGSYTGKGIYELDAFEAALEGRVKENVMLSHDLFEGIFARAGLATDIEVFERGPSHFIVASSRQHRWARGDWQLLPWIFGSGVPLIGRWKMLDNLRRSLVPVMLLATLVTGWCWPIVGSSVWTTFAVLVVLLPALLPLLETLMPRAPGVTTFSHLRSIRLDLQQASWHVAFTFIMAAFTAAQMLDAIVRTLFRIAISHRHRLEWVTAAQVADRSGQQFALAGFYRRMAPGVALALAIGAAVLALHPQAMAPALPFLLLWLAAPAVARWVSLPRAVARSAEADPKEMIALRLIARRTWRFFETFVGPAERSLPPDNFQETPRPVVAHRTSPTNIGLYLLSSVAAQDLGWAGLLDTVDRLEATLDSMGTLEHFRGHLYNWYDTQDGRPLEPKYVSTVDSGNLAGALIALGNACTELSERAPLGARALQGLDDAARLAQQAVAAHFHERPLLADRRPALDDALAAVRHGATQPPSTAEGWARRLAELDERTALAVRVARTVADVDGSLDSSELVGWVAALRAQFASHQRDLQNLAPWATKSIASQTQLEPVARTAAQCARLERAANPALLPELKASAAAATALEQRLTALAQRTRALVKAMDFSFLFDPVRKLFSIGWRGTDAALDPGRYDLLASEARLTSFVAIAKGDAPASHWFRMGRALTPVASDAALISWSGSMFEYLMPVLLVRAPPASLLSSSAQLIVRRQIDYGAERGVPWGVSESAYNIRDLEMTYQYSNFGVPGLGLRRKLVDDVVIAPYATGLAAMIDPSEAVRNFERLTEAGGAGVYGFYEALDYTASRLPEGEKVAVVKAYMAHHQGMTILALANVLDEGAMRTRFHAEPMVQACSLLLQERTPRDVSLARPRAEEVAAARDVREYVPPVARRFSAPHRWAPRTHLLSNGDYSVMMTTTGGGYSRWRDMAITRWREDATLEAGGTSIFLRDAVSGESWSAGYQPRGGEPDFYAVAFTEDRAEIVRREGSIESRLEVIVSAEEDAEIRRVTLLNKGARTRVIELTSYAEVVLAPAAADAAHPAFSKLFVKTEAMADKELLLATRRPRSPGEATLWMAHVLAVEGESVGNLEWETDRSRFIGRGRTLRNALAVTDWAALSKTTGPVLDPIVSLRRRVRLRPGQSAQVIFSTLVAPTREAALNLADTYREVAAFDRAATLAWTQAQVQLHHLGLNLDESQLFQSLASSILYADRTLRAAPEVLLRHAGGPPALWAHGISGDLPIVLVMIDDAEDVGIVRQLLRAHEYWRMKGLAVDLVILNDRAPSYVQDLQNLLDSLVRTSQSLAHRVGHENRGKLFVLRADQITLAQREVLMAVARAVLSSRRGSLAEQLARAHRPFTLALAPVRHPPATPVRSGPPPKGPALDFFNGLGGFSPDGKEYVTILERGRRTPAPWLNVIANKDFGFQVSESGSGYTWAVNSQEHQLTPWSNDPVADPPGEALYVRDEDSGEVWSPTALPIREEAGRYVARHGQGYSRFEYTAHGIGLELLQFVPVDEPVKISRLVLTNQSGRARRLSVTAYVEWVLGVSRGNSSAYIVTELDPGTSAILARNPWSRDFAARVAFADLGGAQSSWTGDRTEFLGRNGSTDRPASLERKDRLSGRLGPALDPCAVLQRTIHLPPQGKVEVLFLLGEAASREEASALITRTRAANLDQRLAAVTAQWDQVLGAVQVRTPDKALDTLLNRWLLYQTLACRVWARAAFYQASGAYGFRDQLQDVLALMVARPDLAKDQLLLSASRQFPEGDVQHWWHPPLGRGIRTRISDDLLWLPYVMSHYLTVTGDAALLEASVPFIEGPLLAAGEGDAYFEPLPPKRSASLYEHCARTIDRSLAVGSHGLPLMGGGDWNDGMNRVGAGGKGESVWLGWFLCAVLRDWAPLAEQRGERERAERWRTHAASLRASIEREAWDGEWYRRATFDDGTFLGTASNDACRIDSIAQTWSVLSGVGDLGRSARAMASFTAQLVKPEDGLVLLLTPPFDETALEPGYIKGYLPGVRENGGQYTHAAAWAVAAFAQLGEGDRAAQLFSMVNPINHARTGAEVARYKAEPYAVAGDVYGAPPHVGRGGWSWYSGSAGWLYRAGLEWILGFKVRGSRLVIDPCIPRGWPRFSLTFRHRSARYEILVENPAGVSREVASATVGGVSFDPALGLELLDDGQTHEVRLVLGPQARAAALTA